MRTEDLIRDPCCQLNLLIWMAKEQPKEGFRVRPLFFELGFTILGIERPMPFPEEILDAIKSSGLAIRKAPEADLLLRRDQDKKALYFEAKAGSFSPESSNSKQARGHLVAVGPAFAEVHAPLSSALLCYVVPEESRKGMQGCLKKLSQKLGATPLQPGRHSVHGLAAESHAVVYHWDAAFSDYTGATGGSAEVIPGGRADTDPSPLILIYTDEDYPDSECRDLLRRVVIEKVHA